MKIYAVRVVTDCGRHGLWPKWPYTTAPHASKTSTKR